MTFFLNLITGSLFINGAFEITLVIFHFINEM